MDGERESGKSVWLDNDDISKSKVGDLSRGWPKDSHFNTHTHTHTHTYIYIYNV